MKVIQISDCHLFADPNKLGYSQVNPFTSLSAVLQQVCLERPDWLLITGDISGDDSNSSYQNFKRLLEGSGIQCPYSIIPGNHDVAGLLTENFAKQNLWQNSPVNLPNSCWQIHLLNSQSEGALGYLKPSDLVQLAAQLGDNPDRFHLLAVHHHPILCDSWMDKHEWTNRQEFIHLIEQFPSVKAVVYGHIHATIETHKNGIEYLSCPSTCWQFAIESNFALSELQPGFRVINLTEDGQVRSSVQRLMSE